MGTILLSLSGVKIEGCMGTVEGFIKEVEKAVKAMVEAAVMAELEAEAEAVLGRRSHARRDKGDRREVQACCPRCGTRRRQALVRNGHRRRSVATLWGVLDIWLPRIRCECGGSVRVRYSVLRPYQRLWADVDEQVRKWGEMGLSLRQMRSELSDLLSSSVGIRALNDRLQAIKQQVWGELKEVPPVLLLDAIWVTVMKPTGQYRRDRKGRLRAVKVRRKVPVLVALGVWAKSGNWVVLDWELAEKEAQPDWERLLLRLEARGVYRERGLELIVHDGGQGLTAALTLIYPTVPHQRCVFHKLRNIWQAIVVPDTLDKYQQRTLRLALIRQAAAIFQAQSKSEAYCLATAFRERWFDQQPAAVLTLERNLDDTLAFFDLLQRFPAWRPQSLRTTSLLERVNRKLRRLFRSAAAYHSDLGLLAATTRVLSPYLAV
jgi:putative transposase